MPDRVQAEKEVRSGLEAYARGDYASALASFDRAISLGDKSWKVLDSKAAVLNRLGETQRAFEVAKGLCKRFGAKNARPWYRVATILSGMEMYDDAERSIAKGLGIPSPSAVAKTLTDLRDKNRRLMELAQQRLSPEERARKEAAAAKAKMCFTPRLSHDVLILIAEAGLASDPNFALRMAGVCAEWRATVLQYSSLWSHLHVTHRRPVEKVELWMQRNKGRLREVTLTKLIPMRETLYVLQALTPHISNVEHLNIHDRSSHYTASWEGKCNRLKSLNLQGRGNLVYGTLFHDLMSPEACAIESIDLEELSLPRHFEHTVGLRGLQSLRKLVIRHGSLIYPSIEMQMPDLLQAAPNLRELTIGLEFKPMAPLPPSLGTHVERLSFPELYKAEMIGYTWFDPHLIELPNLQEFSAFDWDPRRLQSTPATLRTVGVSFSNLVSLEFSRRFPELQTDVLAILPELTSLQFLGIPGTSVDNHFVEALIVEDGKPALLPSLTALSIVQNHTVSAGPIRRLVLSRNCPDMLARITAAAEQKRSAFAPTRKFQTKVRQAPANTSGAVRPKVAKLNWLCLDECDHPHMDQVVIDSLRSHLRFLSFQRRMNAKLDEDRVRGRGAYAWNRPQWREKESEYASVTAGMTTRSGDTDRLGSQKRKGGDDPATARKACRSDK